MSTDSNDDDTPAREWDDSEGDIEAAINAAMAKQTGATQGKVLGSTSKPATAPVATAKPAVTRPRIPSWDNPSPIRPATAPGTAVRQTGLIKSVPKVYVPEHPWTDEQLAVINCQDKRIVVDAFAGCAKTTTAIGFAAARPKKRILYLCLNKANAAEAQKRFKELPNVAAMTTHSIAWSAIKPRQERITREWRPLLFMDQLGLRSASEAKHAMAVLGAFFASSDARINESHCEQARVDYDMTHAAVQTAVATAALAWKRMCDPTDSVQMPHDAYLKAFAIKRPRLPYDCIIFDEAQDANPVTLQILQGQPELDLLCIGDRHQAIYQFRGSVNAMQLLSAGATKLNLSQSWRFGPKAAALANLILGELKGEATAIQGMGQDKDWNGRRTTTLARTNAELFRLAAPRRGEGVSWVGGIDSYKLDQVMDAYHLFARDRDSIKSELMRRKFNFWDEYVKYGEDAGDGEVGIVTKVIEEFKHDVPQLIADMRQNAVPSSADADLTLTSGHRSKGLEWDFVRIADDFEVLAKAEAALSNDSGKSFPEADINLLYVVLTRGRCAVELNTDTKTWLAQLDTHRNNREAFARRQLQMLDEARRRMSGT